MKNYPLAKPHIGKAEIEAVIRVLKSGSLSLGPVYQKFEKAFAKKIGTKYAVTVSSGTAGLHLALLAAGIKPGDEVITTPFSFIASANSILYCGAKPIFVDIDNETYNINPRLIERVVTKKTKAILIVHIFGQTADMDAIMKIAKKHKLIVIEDACEAIGATYKGQKAGTFGQSSVFAFYPNKQMTTGEGGMIVTNSKKIYQLCSSLRNQGRTENMQWLDHKLLGYNYRMDEMSAAVGLAQLKKLDFMTRERQKLAKYYTKYLRKHSALVQIPTIKGSNIHTWFVYVVQLKSKVNRAKVIKNLERSGIHTKPYLPSIHLYSFYRKILNYRRRSFPVSENVSRNALALPFYIGLRDNDIRYIVNKLINSLHAKI